MALDPLTILITDSPVRDLVVSTNGLSFPFMTVSSNVITLLGTSMISGVGSTGGGGGGGGGGLDDEVPSISFRSEDAARCGV